MHYVQIQSLYNSKNLLSIHFITVILENEIRNVNVSNTDVY